MKLSLITLIFSVIFLFASTAFAFTVPAPTGFVTDTAGKLSSSDKIKLENKLKAIQEATSNEVAVLIVPTLGGETIEDATHQVFQTWKVGKAGLDNGVLLVIAANDRKMRIQTGKGVEGDLTDIQTQDILRDMKPFLRKNDFAGACNFAVSKIASTLESRKGQKPDEGTGAKFNQPLPAPEVPASAGSHQNVTCSFGFGSVGFGLSAILVFGFVGILFLIRRFIKNAEEEEWQAKEARRRELANRTNVTQSYVPPVPIYTPPVVVAPRETLRKPVAPPESDSEPTLPDVLTTVAAAAALTSVLSPRPRGKSYSNLELDEELVDENDVEDDDSDSPSSFGGGDTGGGGSSISWDDDSSSSITDLFGGGSSDDW